jgi:hypothetical protein
VTTLRTKKNKGGGKPPPGGGAAGRIGQYNRQRGLPDKPCPADEAPAPEVADAKKDEGSEKGTDKGEG